MSVCECVCGVKAPRRQIHQAEKSCVAVSVTVSEPKFRKLHINTIKTGKRSRGSESSSLFPPGEKILFTKSKEFSSEAETEAAPGSSFSARCVGERNTGNNGEGKYSSAGSSIFIFILNHTICGKCASKTVLKGVGL